MYITPLSPIRSFGNMCFNAIRKNKMLAKISDHFINESGYIRKFLQKNDMKMTMKLSITYNSVVKIPFKNIWESQHD